MYYLCVCDLCSSHWFYGSKSYIIHTINASYLFRVWMYTYKSSARRSLFMGVLWSHTYTRCNMHNLRMRSESCAVRACHSQKQNDSRRVRKHAMTLIINRLKKNRLFISAHKKNTYIHTFDCKYENRTSYIDKPKKIHTPLKVQCYAKSFAFVYTAHMLNVSSRNMQMCPSQNPNMKTYPLKQ